MAVLAVVAVYHFSYNLLSGAHRRQGGQVTVIYLRPGMAARSDTTLHFRDWRLKEEAVRES